jgi:transcription elongation factor Elf1
MLTKEQKNNYLKTGGVHCPYCGSERLDVDPFDGEGSYQPVTCGVCDKEWRDIYQLVDIEEVDDD